jgi:hypothetical protein
VIQLSVRKVNPEHLELFRHWMAQIDGPRRAEALATLMNEGCTHEIAALIEGPDGPIVIYAMEIESVERSRNAAENSTYAIDKDHYSVMERATGDRVPLEILLDLRPPALDSRIGSAPNGRDEPLTSDTV